MPLDPHKRIADATVLSPSRTVDSESYGLALVARPVGYGRAATVTTATVEGSASAGAGKVDVWFARGVQWSVKRVTHGAGDAQDVPVAHAMGGNVVACPEPMNLQFHNNDRALIGGDYANRARPWDVLELSYAGGTRRFLVESAAAFAKAPSTVNYSPSSAVTKTQDFGPTGALDLASHFLTPIYPEQELFLESSDLTGDAATLYSAMQVLWRNPSTEVYTASARTKFTAAGSAVVSPFTAAVEDYLPNNADLGGASSRYYWDKARQALRFNDATRTLGAEGVSVSGWLRSATAGQFFSYVWVGDDSSIIDLALEGHGAGLASSGGDHRVARAVEAWGDENFVARVNFRNVFADSGFGKAGLAVSNGIRPGARQIVVDWYGGTPRVYTIATDGTVTHVATFPSAADDEEWDVSIARSDAVANEWTIVWYTGGGSTTIATVTFDLGTDSPLVGPYAAENSKLRWYQYDGTPGPATGYTHTRDSLSDDEPSYFATRVAGVDPTFDFGRREELLLEDETVATIVNVTADDEEMTLASANNPTARNEYGVNVGATPSDPPTLILSTVAAGDRLRVTYEPSDPPEAPGDYPPAQGRLNFSTDGGSVSQNRANYFDQTTILDPNGEWPSGSAADGASVTFRRDPCWETIDAVEFALYDAGGSPSWSTIGASDRYDFPVDGYVLLKDSWIAANLSAGQRYLFRITGTEFQRTGGFDAESHRLIKAAYESLDEAWLTAATSGGGSGPNGLISSVDFELGVTGYANVGGSAVPTGMAYGTRSEVLHNADPEVDDSSLTSCGTPSRTLDTRGWDRSRWPANSFLGNTGPSWIGASDSGIDAGSILGGLACSHDITVEDALVYEEDTTPGASETRGFGARLTGTGSGEGQISARVWLDGIGLSLSDNLSRLPAGSTVVEAFAEVVVPDDLTVTSYRTEYVGPGRVPSIGTFGFNRYINGGLVAEYWETWNGSSWVVTTPIATYSTPANPTSFDLGFALMGTRRHTRSILLPEKASASEAYVDMEGDLYVSLGASLPTTVSANGLRQLVNFTEIIQALVADRNSTNDPDGYFLWPTGGTVPSLATIASEGAHFGLLRSMLPEYEVANFATNAGQYAAEVDTGTMVDVTMPTALTIGRILARVRLPSGTIDTLSVPSPIPALVVE